MGSPCACCDPLSAPCGGLLPPSATLFSPSLTFPFPLLNNCMHQQRTDFPIQMMSETTPRPGATPIHTRIPLFCPRDTDTSKLHTLYVSRVPSSAATVATTCNMSSMLMRESSLGTRMKRTNIPNKHASTAALQRKEVNPRSTTTTRTYREVEAYLSRRIWQGPDVYGLNGLP